MSPRPLRPGEGKFPDDQIFAQRPPSRDHTAETGELRYPWTVSVVDSYRQTVLRIWPDDTGAAFDVVPNPDGDQPSADPSQLYGPHCGPVYFISGNNAWGRPSTKQDNDDTLERLTWRLDFHGEKWSRAVASSSRRGWVEKGAVVRDISEGDVLSDAARHGQSVVLRWDESGLLPLATRPGVDVGEDGPVPVTVVPAKTGCPLRMGASDGPCKMYGGPWTSSSITAAYVWRNFRTMLLDAYGCDVCGGEGGEGARGATELFLPSREGGWQWGSPRTRSQLCD